MNLKRKLRFLNTSAALKELKGGINQMELISEDKDKRIYRLENILEFRCSLVKREWSLACEDPLNLSEADLEWAVSGEYFGFADVDLGNESHRYSIRKSWRENALLGEIDEALKELTVYYTRSPQLDEFAREYK